MTSLSGQEDVQQGLVRAARGAPSDCWGAEKSAKYRVTGKVGGNPMATESREKCRVASKALDGQGSAETQKKKALVHKELFLEHQHY